MNPSPLRWRETVLEKLAREFASDPCALWRINHARDVEREVSRLLQCPENQMFAEEERLSLQAAALLHEIPSASGIHEISGEIQEFKDSPRLVPLVEKLISNCDTTLHRFPTAVENGAPLKTQTTDLNPKTQEFVAFLKEADALAHLENAYLDISVESWLATGIPRVRNAGGCIATWMWNDSVVGNLRLTAKRGLLDAQTPSGKTKAHKAYYRVEDLVRTQCQLANVFYEEEVCSPEMLELSREKMSKKDFSLEIVRFYPWNQLEDLIRRVPLQGSRKIRPYEKASISCSLSPIKTLSSLSNYVMEDRLKEVEELHHAFMVTFCFGLWDLPGIVEFKYNNESAQVLAPPIVEVHEKSFVRKEPARYVKGKTDYVLIDGLHRAMVAEKNSLCHLRAVVIAGVDYPPMAFAKDWGNAKEYVHPPGDAKKREYRYESLEQFSKEPFAKNMRATEKTYRYYLYRDLSSLGSEGRRTFDEYTKKRNHRRSDSAGA